MMHPNPDARPAADRDDGAPTPTGALTLAEAEALRRAHLWHESHLRSIGGLMVLFGACALFPGLLIFGIVSFSATAVVLLDGDPLGVLRFVWPTLSVGLLFSTSGALFLVAGFGLRRLDPNLRLGASLVVCLWLLKVSALSVLTPLALYLLWSRAGRVVLSPRYQAAMRLTPDIPSRWSVLFWLALPLLVWGFRVWTKARFF